MKKVRVNTFMMIVILSLSCFILIFAFTAYLLPKYEKEKDIDFFSDNYVRMSFYSEDKDISQIMAYYPEELIKDVAVLFQLSNAKAIHFSEEILEEIGVDISKLEQFDVGEDVAIVNDEQVDKCYEKDGIKFLSCHGIAYRVIGTFSDEKVVKSEETFVYLNLNGDKIQKNKYFSCIVYDTRNENDSVVLVGELQQRFQNAFIEKWNGEKFNVWSARSMYVTYIVMCGIIICFNCIGFTESWIAAKKKEIGVRLIVGGTPSNINIWLIEKYFSFSIISCICGTLTAFITINVLKRFEEFESLRYLFGIKLYFIPVCIAWLTTIGMGLITLEICYAKYRKKSILNNVRGSKVA